MLCHGTRTIQDARQYQAWLWRDFVLDGVAFFDRPFFYLSPECHVWEVVGVADLAPDDEQQVVVRTERFQVPATSQDVRLAARWSQVLAEARRCGLTGVWLLQDQPEQLVSLVSFADRAKRAQRAERSAPLTPDARDAVALQLEQAPPLGDVFAGQGWTRTFDRTQSVLTLWFPSVPGDHGRPAVWPNSPPLPGPVAPTTASDRLNDYPGSA